jgi:iron complex transport system substrate-binding protein
MNLFSDKMDLPCNLYLKLSIIFILVFASCNNFNRIKHIEKSDNNQIIKHAERLRIVKKEGYSIVSIFNPWQGAENVNHVYYLVKKGTTLPTGIDSLSIIYVPVRKIICMSSTHVAMVCALNEESTISGLSGKELVYSEKVKNSINKGLVYDIGYEGNLNKELILNNSPDLVMTYGIGSESEGYVNKIKELGIRVLFNADYLENDPLGKSEWIRLFGELYCKENLADSIFTAEVNEYNKLRLFIDKNISTKPKVLLGLPFKDTWYISPGNSYTSKLIADAGGEYIWNNTISSISMPYGIENVYLKALNADYWLNIGGINTKEEISSIDQRLMDLPCYRNGNLYNNNKRVTITGGNDYWETGTVYPHIILKDISSILHSDLFADTLYFYRKISE